MNNKGFTVVELIVSFALTVIVVGMLFQMLLSLKEVYIASGFKSQMINKQTLISSKINQDLNNKTLKIALKCGDNCLNFIYEDGTNKKLIIDDNNSIFTYGDYSTKLVNGSVFGDFYIKNEKIVGLDSTSNYDSVIEIKVPINHSLLKEDYGINIIYQYNSNTSSIADIIFDESNSSEDKIVFKGSSHMYHINNTTFTDPGYYVYKGDGTVVDMSSDVIKTGSVGNTLGTTYVLIYTLKDGSNNTIDIATREVTVVKGLYEYDYTGNYQTFIAPFDGTYQFEAWGAQGNGTNEASVGASIGGKGAYTKGNVYLQKGENIYVYVGQGGKLVTTTNISDANNYSANFNGGGAGAFDTAESALTGEHGFSGGGATDFRIISAAWNDSTSLRSRIMVAGAGGGGGWSGNGSADQYYTGGGGNAGSLTGFGPQGATTSTIGTQTTGFGFGTGGLGRFASANNNGTGGGGGGYYGGDSGLSFVKPNSSGSGGSSFISGHAGVNAINAAGVHTNSTIHYSGYAFFNTSMIAGDSSMPNPRAAGNITGNTGNGYAKVTLLSVVDEYNGDTTAPVITLNGGNVSQIAGIPYNDAGIVSAIDNLDGDLTTQVSMISNVAIGSPGTYYVTYNVYDANGNLGTVTRTVTITPDPIPTVAFSMYENTTYAKTRSTTVTVSDVGSGLNTGSLKYQWTTNTTQPSEVSFSTSFTNNTSISTPASQSGNYYLWILAKDNFGGTMIDRSGVFYLDNTGPVITITGSNPFPFTAGIQGSTYSDQGATASDAVSGAATVSSSGTVNSDVMGTYTITYSSTDALGNTSTLNRTVNVDRIRVDYLIVAGGGGGGSTYHGGGGGAGGLLTSNITVTTKTNTITVGTGGAGGTATNIQGSNGNNSSAFGLTAIGGGGGGKIMANGSTGGSGGGAGGDSVQTGYIGGLGTSGQGNNGGNQSFTNSGGGGGGAGGVGSANTSSAAGGGGVGLANTLRTGATQYYAAGGGGGGGPYQTAGVGGSSIGGRGGSRNQSFTATAGTANTGSGGGGGDNGNGGAGGSGIIVIRYYGAAKATGGTITSVSGYTVHTFTSSGTFTLN